MCDNKEKIINYKKMLRAQWDKNEANRKKHVVCVQFSPLAHLTDEELAMVEAHSEKPL